MRKIIPLGILIAILFTSCKQQENVTTFYLVRHAEKVESNTMTDQRKNPPLTDEGRQRAIRLKEMLAAKDIAVIYSTDYQRNKNTVKPLAEEIGMTIRSYQWHKWQPIIDEALERFAGKTVLICGHGDNLLPMIEYLGAQRPQDKLGTHEYDKIFKVVRRDNKTSVEVIKY